MVPEVIRRTAVGGLLLIGGLFMLFVVGYALEVPGGWAGAAVSGAWVAPTGLLCWLAWKRPTVGAPVVVVLVVLVTLGWLALPLASEALRALFDRLGPVLAIATVTAALGCAALGVHRPRLAGWLLIGLAFVNAAGIYVEAALHDRIGPGVLDLLATSGGVVAVPMAIAGGLLVVADQLGRLRTTARVGDPASA